MVCIPLCEKCSLDTKAVIRRRVRKRDILLNYELALKYSQDMCCNILPQHRRPVLLQTEPGRRKLTQIAVDRVQAQDGHYHVLYIGTGTYTAKNE